MYDDNEYIFWPDLASAHYAKNSIDFKKANNINFVAKGDNPPNVSHARTIENFWGDVCLKVY